MKINRITRTGIIALPGVACIGGNIDPFTDKEGNKTQRVARSEKDVLINRAFNNKNLRLSDIAWVDPVICPDPEREIFRRINL